MPTTADLGALVKQRYPGAYDSYDNAVLGRAVQRRYPGAYSQFTDAPGTSAPPADSPTSAPPAAAPRSQPDTSGMVAVHQVPTMDAAMSPQQRLTAAYLGQPPPVRALMQAGQAAEGALLPGPVARGLERVMGGDPSATLPPPSGGLERTGQIVGGAAGFVGASSLAELAAMRAFQGLRPLEGVGEAIEKANAARALARGTVGAAAAAGEAGDGTLKQRLARAGTTAAAVPLAGALGARATGMFEAQVPEKVAEAMGNVVGPAIAFGQAQPRMEASLEGRKLQPGETDQATADMLALSALTAPFHYIPIGRRVQGPTVEDVASAVKSAKTLAPKPSLSGSVDPRIASSSLQPDGSLRAAGAATGSASARPEPTSPAVEPTAPTPGKRLTDSQGRILLGMAKRIESTRKNPLDGNRTPYEGLRDRLMASLPDDPSTLSDADFRQLAGKAYSQAKGLHDIWRLSQPVPAPSDAARAVQDEATSALSGELVGKPLAVKTGDRAKSVREGVVVRADVIPHAAGTDEEPQVRVFLSDPHTKETRAYGFKTLEDFRGRIQSEGRASVKPQPEPSPSPEATASEPTTGGKVQGEESPSTVNEPAPASPERPFLRSDILVSDPKSAQRLADGIASAGHEARVVKVGKMWGVEVREATPDELAARRSAREPEPAPPAPQEAKPAPPEEPGTVSAEQEPVPGGQPPAAEAPKAEEPPAPRQGKRGYRQGDKVAVPYVGKSKRAARDYGTVLGYAEDSKGGEPQVLVRVSKGRGKYEDRVVPESDMRRRPTMDNRPAHLRYPGLAAEMEQRVGGNHAAAAIEISIAQRALAKHEADYRAPYDQNDADQVIAHARSRRLMRRAEDQLRIAEHVAAKAGMKPEDIRAQAQAGETTTKVATKIGIMAGEAHTVAGHVFDKADQARADLQAARDLHASKEADDFDPAAIEHMAEVEASFKEASDAASEVARWMRDAVKQAKKDGSNLSDALYAVQERVLREHPPTPPDMDWGGGRMSFMGTGALSGMLDKYVGRKILDGIPKAYDRARRAMGRNNRLRVMKNGFARASHDIVPPAIPDVWAESGAIRALAALGKWTPVGGHISLLPDLVAQHNMSAFRHADAFGEMKLLLHSMIRPEDAKWIEPYSPEARRLAAHLQKLDDTPLPPDGQRVADAMRKWYSHLHDIASAHAELMGQEPLGKIADYGGPLVHLGRFVDDIRPLIEQLNGGKELAPAQMAQIVNRFFFEREGSTQGLRLDAGLDADDYAHALSKKVAFDHFLAEYKKALDRMPQDDPRREAMLNWGRQQMFPRNNEANDIFNRGAKYVLYAKLNRGIEPLDRAKAADWLGRSINTMDQHPDSKYVWVRKGQQVQLPNHTWEKVGDANGGSIYAGVGGRPANVTAGELRPFFQKIAEAQGEVGAHLHRIREMLYGRKVDMDRQRVIERHKMLDSIAQLQNRPADAFLRLISRGSLNGLVGYNLKTVLLHLGNVAFTTMPEYLFNDPAAIAEGTARYTKASAMRTFRTMTNWAEKRGFIDSGRANRWRGMAPLMAEEVLARALGSTGSDIEYASAGPRGSVVRPAETGARAKVLDLLKPTGLLHSAIPFVRGWDAAIHIAHARRAGFTSEMLGQTWAHTEQVERQVTRALAMEQLTKGSAMQYGSVMWPKTIPDYGRLGRGGYMSTQLGRTLFQFGLFGKEIMLNNFIRPTEGFGRTILGGDMSPAQTRNARTFLAQVAMGGAMLALGSATGLNLAWLASPLQNVLLMKAIADRDKKNKTLQHWNANMQEAGQHSGARIFAENPREHNMVVNMLRGLGFGMSTLFDMGEMVKKDKAGAPHFDWDALQSMLENYATGSGAIRKAVRDNPEVIKAEPRVVPALGIKSYVGYPGLRGADFGTRVQDQLGVMDATRRKELTRRLPR